jgi:hypothetical protein
MMGYMSTNKFLFLRGCLDFTEKFLNSSYTLQGKRLHIEEEIKSMCGNGFKVNYKNLQFFVLDILNYRNVFQSTWQSWMHQEN